MTETTVKIYNLEIEDIKKILARQFKVEEENVDLHISEYSNDFGDHSVNLFCEVKVEKD